MTSITRFYLQWSPTKISFSIGEVKFFFYEKLSFVSGAFKTRCMLTWNQHTPAGCFCADVCMFICVRPKVFDSYSRKMKSK